MPRLSRDAQQRLRDASALLLDPASARERALDLVALQLSALMDVDRVGAYALAMGTRGSVVVDDVAVGGGLDPDGFHAMASRIVGAGKEKLLYRPLRPQPTHRNRVVSLDDLAPAATRKVGRRVPQEYGVVGVDRLDQLRVVVCDGPVQLAWIGGWREAPFTWKDRTLFARVLPAVRSRLILTRRLAVDALGFAAVEAALEAVSAPAAVVTLRGETIRVLHANELAKAEIEARRSQMLAELAAALRDGETGGARWLLSPLSAPGSPAAWLAVRRVPAEDPGPRLAAIRERLLLTDRQTEVLERIVLGESNKEIAAWLGCAEGTVELHVTAILRKSGLSNRVELVARFWTDRL